MNFGLLNAGILGCGSYVPPRIVTNNDLAAQMETSDDWIVSRTGIRERRIAAPEVSTSDLAIEAARRAIADAGILAGEIDLVVVATCTPDHPGSFPSTAAIVQHAIGAHRAGAFDIGAVCAGFSYALHVVAQMVRTGSVRNVLVVGAETMSRIVDWTDRNTAVLFGDGAGAVIVGHTEAEGYVGGLLGADGGGASLLSVPAGGSRTPVTPDCLETRANTIYQNGREVYKFAVVTIGEAAIQALEAAGLNTADVDCFIPHQANIRIISKAAERMGLSMDKVFVNLDCYGNTSSASIPLALDESVRAGMVVPGSLVVMVGFGGGLTWAANVLRWNK